ncbi:ATP-binding protein [Enterococcus sp. DIV1420a]|uniref:ATP-binding protein n=1 Tax=Enterococcus sp. DIV1420a TaxID=2774672 RepID=UPI003F20AC3C
MDFPLLDELRKTNERCPIHNIPLNQFKDHEPFCMECKKKYLRNIEQETVNRAFEKHERRRTIEVLETDSIVGDPKLWQASFNNYQTDNEETKNALLKARQIAAEYLKAIQIEKQLEKKIAVSEDKEEKAALKKKLLEVPKFNTIFTGVPGVGKSHLAMGMLRAINETANPMMSCLFVSVNDLFRLIKSSFGKPDSKYSELNMTRLLSSVDLLVIDDLGSEASFRRGEKDKEAGNYTQNVLFGILNARQRTIITTNLNSDDLEDVYNAKIVSRLYKGVEGRIIKFTSATNDKRSKVEF